MRFFIKQQQINENKINLTEEDSKHIKVARIQKDEKIYLCDENKKIYVCNVELVEKKYIANILEIIEQNNESNVNITLFQCMPKSDKMDLIVQKCVEIGVNNIVPVSSEFTIVKINEKIENKINRWQKISESASKQSKRNIIPKINNAVLFKDALIMAQNNNDLNLVAYEKHENKDKNNLKNILRNKNYKNIGIFIGSEGGFSEKEITLCESYNIIPISLGKTILRAETASIVLTNLIIYENNN